jgi:hypothetical protein
LRRLRRLTGRHDAKLHATLLGIPACLSVVGPIFAWRRVPLRPVARVAFITSILAWLMTLL